MFKVLEVLKKVRFPLTVPVVWIILSVYYLAKGNIVWALVSVVICALTLWRTR